MGALSLLRVIKLDNIPVRVDGTFTSTNGNF